MRDKDLTYPTYCEILFQDNRNMVIPQDDKEQYQWIRWLRVGVIMLSAVMLLANIILIIKKKQYKFNTIRLFMFVQIFYVLSLLSVVFHSPSFNFDVCQFVDPKPQTSIQYTISQFYDCIINEGEPQWTAIEGFVNMFCYTLSYWFAVCITLYIKHVLQNTHKQFMKRRGPLIFVVCLGIGMWFLVPFALAFIEDVPFSFGPAGYKYMSEGTFFFYGGIISRREKGQDTTSQIMVLIWMLGVALLLFAYHIYLLCVNQRHIRKLIELDEINPRQFFMIKSGRLSFVIFFVQLLNVGKLALSFVFEVVEEEGPGSQNLVFSLNVLFDLMPMILIFIYLKYYYREGRDLQERSQLINRSLITSFHNSLI